jgi:FkbM family methyltransferase
LIDCGCNYGFYSLYTASLSDQNSVIAIEASLTTAEDFEKNINLNKFDNIVLKNFAISDTDNVIVNFNESKNDWESSLTHKEFDEKKVSKIRTQKIDTIIKDQKLNEYLLLIKLDIEGHELQALEGAKNTIEKYKPIIIIELSTYIFNKNDKAFDRLKFFLTEFDYSIYNTQKKLISLEDIIISINNLDSEHETIGNYYLINNKNNLNFIQ